MKLAAKLILIFMLGVLAIVILFSWQTIQRQQQWAEQQHEASAASLVDALQPTIEQAYHEGGTIRIQHAVEVRMQEQRGTEVRWVDPELPAEADRSRNSVAPLTNLQSRTVTSISITDGTGSKKLYTYVPLNVDGNESGAVEVATSLTRSDNNVRRSLITSLISLLGVAILSGLVIFLGGLKLVAHPLKRLIFQVQQIGEGQFAQPPVLATSDELGQLAVAISEMSYRLAEQKEAIQQETEAKLNTQQLLRHVDRLGTIGTLAAGMAHELGTPLNVVAGRAGLISRGQLTSEEVTSSAKTIQAEAERMTTIIRQLLDFARRNESPHELIDVGGLISQTCELMQPLAKKQGVQLKFNKELGRTISLSGDRSQLQQVLTNLVNNSIQAMPGGGVVEIRCSMQTTDSPAFVESSGGEYACIEVIDSGTGMVESDVEHVFEPFYTTKDVGQGTGLGLSIAYGIVRDHDGWIDVSSIKNEGTTFRVWLPINVRE